MMPHQQPREGKTVQRRIVAGLLAVIVMGGVASYFLSQDKVVEAKEEFVIVDLSAPPPPPPPPPPKEEEIRPEPEESMDESPEIAEADAPEDFSDEPTSDIDLGIDAGDLAAGEGGSFLVAIPRFARGGGRGDGGEGLLGTDIDSPPSPISKIQPTYPNSLLSKGIGGRTIIACVVDDKGMVTSTSIKQSAGHSDLDNAALSAVAKWKFKPATKSGRNVRASCLVPFNFEVKKN
jgi:protein TonB